MTALLLTRPDAASDDFADLCRARGFAGDVTISPVMDIVATGPVPDLAPFPTLIFTSPRATRGIAGPFTTAHRAFAVGDATADAVRALGLPCLSARGTVEDLLALLIAESPPGPFLHLRGRVSRGALAARLSAAGLPTKEAIVYDAAPRPLSPAAMALLSGDRPVIVPLFSPRAAALLAAALPPCPGPLRLCAISAAARDAWGRDDPVTVAARPDAAAMVDLVIDLARD